RRGRALAYALSFSQRASLADDATRRGLALLGDRGRRTTCQRRSATAVDGDGPVEAEHRRPAGTEHLLRRRIGPRPLRLGRLLGRRLHLGEGDDVAVATAGEGLPEGSAAAERRELAVRSLHSHVVDVVREVDA